MSGYIGSKASVVSSGAERKKTYSITGTTTVLTGASYTPNQVHVFHNGVRLVDGTDYTATDGSTVTLTTAAENGDEVVVISYATFQTSDTVSASAGGTFSNAVTIDANGATVLTVDRETSDGTIIDVQKGGTSVGSIESYAGVVTGMTLYPAGNVGIRGATSEIVAYANGADRDASVSLGDSATRFKDLYLSGGVYLGGTGAANYLDDYEEGTWTPTSGQASISAYKAVYTKIGNTVHIQGYIAINSPTASNFILSGLPFTVEGDGWAPTILNKGYGTDTILIRAYAATTTLDVRDAADAQVLATSLGSWATFQLTYKTTA